MYQISSQFKIQPNYQFQSKLKHQKSLYIQATAAPGAEQLTSQLSSQPLSPGQYGP